MKALRQWLRVTTAGRESCNYLNRLFRIMLMHSHSERLKMLINIFGLGLNIIIIVYVSYRRVEVSMYLIEVKKITPSRHFSQEGASWFPHNLPTF